MSSRLRILLTVTSGPHQGREFSFDAHENFIVGRAKAAQFRLSAKDQYFSRNHFLVEVNPPLCRLLDLNSTNGTFVNGKQVSSVELNDGDLIEAGDTTLRVNLVSTTPAPSMQNEAFENLPARPSVSPQAAAGNQTIVPRNWSRGPPDDSPSMPAKLHPTGGQTKNSPAIEATLVPAGKRVAGPELLCATLPGPKASLSDEDRAKIAAQPQPFDGYDIIEEIGRGGMGVVYRAHSKHDGEIVAMKVVLPVVECSPEDLGRFVREAEIVKELIHPHIVPFREFGHAAGQMFFAMKYIPGVDCQKYLRQQKAPLPISKAVDITCQMLDALAAAHDSGYVHRDVKPANLIIESSANGEFVWLTDFGLARTYQASKLSGLTTTGNMGGTLPFMAPEQITHFRDVTPAADQYSAAATLYYLLTRHHTYDFPKDVAKQLLLVLQEPPRPIQERRPDISDQLAVAIHKALERMPSDRYPYVRGFRDALLSAISCSV